MSFIHHLNKSYKFLIYKKKWHTLHLIHMVQRTNIWCSSNHKCNTVHSQRKCCDMHRLKTSLPQTRWKSSVVRGNVLKAFALPHQGPLQDDPALLVALTFLCSKLVHPAQLAVAVLAADVSHHVVPCQHLSVLHVTMLQIHNLEMIG